MSQEQEYAVIRVKRDTWTKLKIVAAVLNSSISDIADRIMEEGLSKYDAEIESVVGGYDKEKR